MKSPADLARRAALYPAARRDLSAADRRGDRPAPPLRRPSGAIATARRCSSPASPGRACSSCSTGQVAVSQRDGLGRRQPLVEQGPGQFLAEAGQLSGRPALVDGHAEGDGRGDPDPARRPARAAGRRGRARRADHPGADPAPGAADPAGPRRAADHRRCRTTPTWSGSRPSSAATAIPTRCADPTDDAAAATSSRQYQRRSRRAAAGDRPDRRGAAQPRRSATSAARSA